MSTETIHPNIGDTGQLIESEGPVNESRLINVDEIMPLGYAYALAEVAHNYNMEHPDHRLAINVVANEYEDTHITRRGRIGDRNHSTPVVVDKGHVHISSEMPLSVKQKARDLWEQRKQELQG